MQVHSKIPSSTVLTSGIWSIWSYQGHAVCLSSGWCSVLNHDLRFITDYIVSRRLRHDSRLEVAWTRIGTTGRQHWFAYVWCWRKDTQPIECLPAIWKKLNGGASNPSIAERTRYGSSFVTSSFAHCKRNSLQFHPQFIWYWVFEKH